MRTFRRMQDNPLPEYNQRCADKVYPGLSMKGFKEQLAESSSSSRSIGVRARRGSHRW